MAQGSASRAATLRFAFNPRCPRMNILRRTTSFNLSVVLVGAALAIALVLPTPVHAVGIPKAFVQPLKGSQPIGEPRRLTAETARDISIYS